MIKLIGKAVEKVRHRRTGGKQYKVIYLETDNTFYIKSGSLVPIAEESLDIEGCRIIYSTPNNNHYKAWHPKRYPLGFKCPKDRTNNILFILWSKYKPGDVVKGDIKDGRFFISTDSKD